MAAVAINYLAYNFIKIHSTFRTSPAKATGVTNRPFDVSVSGARIRPPMREQSP